MLLAGQTLATNRSFRSAAFREVLSFGEIRVADDLCTPYCLGTYGDDNQKSSCDITGACGLM